MVLWVVGVVLRLVDSDPFMTMSLPRIVRTEVALSVYEVAASRSVRATLGRFEDCSGQFCAVCHGHVSSRWGDVLFSNLSQPSPQLAR